MNATTRGRRAAARFFVVGLLLSAAGGCASGGFPARPPAHQLAPGSPLRSHTLPEGDAWLRHYLMNGQHDAALQLLDASATRPRDAVQRMLQRAVVQHHAGRHAESNQSLDRAERLIDARQTRSARQAAGSLLINDRVVDYRPAAVEQAMVHYYRLSNYLALDSLESALVEARRTSHLLARMQERSGVDCGVEPFLHYLAGLVFDAGGEPNDALVSFRLAERGFGECRHTGASGAPPQLGADLYRTARRLGIDEVADSAAVRYALDERVIAEGDGELVVVIEHGFAAHRMQRALHVPVLAAEIDSLSSGDTRAVTEAAAAVAARLAGNLVEQHFWGDAWDDHPVRQLGAMLAGAHVLKLAWPVYRLEANRPAAVRVLVGDTALDAAVLEDVSGQLVRDLQREQLQVLTRAVARSLVKYLAATELKGKAKKEGGEAAEFVVGLLANAAGNALEQADTRGWSLLPDQVSVARLRLPAGSHSIRLEVQGSAGREPFLLELGDVQVAAGGRTFVSRRVWGDERGVRSRPASEPAVGGEEHHHEDGDQRDRDDAADPEDQLPDAVVVGGDAVVVLNVQVCHGLACA